MSTHTSREEGNPKQRASHQKQVARKTGYSNNDKNSIWNSVSRENIFQRKRVPSGGIYWTISVLADRRNRKWQRPPFSQRTTAEGNKDVHDVIKSLGNSDCGSKRFSFHLNPLKRQLSA